MVVYSDVTISLLKYESYRNRATLMQLWGHKPFDEAHKEKKLIICIEKKTKNKDNLLHKLLESSPKVINDQEERRKRKKKTIR